MRAGIAVFLFGSCLLPSLWAQKAEPNIDRLKARVITLTAESDRLERTLNNLQSDSMRLSDEVNRLELERAVINANIERYEVELESLGAQIAETEIRLAEQARQAKTQEERISKRLRQLYKRGNLGYAQLFLKQSRREELLTAYHYAQVLTRRDNQILQDYQQTLTTLRRLRGELDTMRGESEAARAGLEEKRAEQDVLLKKRASKLADIKRQSSRKKRLLEELELEREELEIMVRRLTEDVDPWEIAIPITRYKGKLNWPAQGRVKRKFGIIRDPEFATRRRQNGLDIAATEGKPIRSVYSGRVLFADWFKSYGNLIIIDHRDKVTSFYAHCSQMLVEKGDYIERDQIIGYVGDTGSLEGPMLHFEMRNKTKPEDPAKWLRRKKRR